MSTIQHSFHSHHNINNVLYAHSISFSRQFVAASVRFKFYDKFSVGALWLSFWREWRQWEFKCSRWSHHICSIYTSFHVYERVKIMWLWIIWNYVKWNCHLEIFSSGGNKYFYTNNKKTKSYSIICNSLEPFASLGSKKKFHSESRTFQVRVNCWFAHSLC